MGRQIFSGIVVLLILNGMALAGQSAKIAGSGGGDSGTIALSISPTAGPVGSTFTFTATVTNDDNSPASGVVVTFSPGGTATTNSSGIATKTYSGWATIGDKTVTASADDYGSDQKTATVDARLVQFNANPSKFPKCIGDPISA